jgi:hypothetical protein
MSQKIRLEVELEVADYIHMHEPDEKQLLMEHVLPDSLELYSGLIGDNIGKIRFLEGATKSGPDCVRVPRDLMEAVLHDLVEGLNRAAYRGAAPARLGLFNKEISQIEDILGQGNEK